MVIFISTVKANRHVHGTIMYFLCVRGAVPWLSEPVFFFFFLLLLLLFFAVVCPEAQEGSIGSGSGFKRLGKQGQLGLEIPRDWLSRRVTHPIHHGGSRN